MVVQTSYPETPAKAFVGMLAEQFSMRQLDSYFAEGSSGLMAGQAVERGTDPEKQVIQLATAANFMGVTVQATQDLETVGEDKPLYSEKEILPVMDDGRIWVYSGAAVAVGDEVVPSTGANTKFSPGAGTSNHKCYARSAASATDELLLIEVVGPQG